MCSGSSGNRNWTAARINNNPRKTCNSRRAGKSACSAATPIAANRRDNTAKHLRTSCRPALAARFAFAQRVHSCAQPRFAKHLWAAAEDPHCADGPGRTVSSRHVPRRDGYSISPCKGKAVRGFVRVLPRIMSSRADLGFCMIRAGICDTTHTEKRARDRAQIRDEKD